ncbi:DUF58 domain-containing protein [Neorhodopirellula pilleata]|uniref:Uncharacterized protein n=1 Tax=Neorhodopirellula pilleata TaxID=2714738 RepID=A0A5C6A2G6_9BACT|nr:DUF58 domain-containing protein [Neorhodopirellula pilleata]TWT93530.1 hypothetical protein Pla100_40480 [Neorhodopirellula pilleata]
MAMAHDVPMGGSLAARLLTTDFCPWANRFVYWLKEPVGWFVLATAISVIVGVYLAPIGWTLAASLGSVIAVGMVWPAIAVRAVSCRLSPGQSHVHEGDPCELRLAVRNRLPMPVWGLAVEGFLDRRIASDDAAAVPTVALAFVRALATSTYHFTIRPELRGRYPDGDAILTCSFPFGIWTAKRKLRDISPVTVWPKVYPIAGQTAMTGRRAAETGEGNRTGRAGDFLGVREYRRGDCMRQVNWIATARSGDLVVTQRSGPQCPSVEVIVDAARTRDRDQLADRIRVAASVLANLHQASVPLRVYVGQRCFHVRRGWDGFVQMMDALAEVPADGFEARQLSKQSGQRASITIASAHGGDVAVCISDPAVNHRLAGGHSHRMIRRDQGLAQGLMEFWTEVRDANLVA